LLSNPAISPWVESYRGFSAVYPDTREGSGRHFWVRVGLDKKALIGTMVASSVIVDIARLLIYGVTFFELDFHVLIQQDGFYLVVAGSSAAFIGSFIGSRLLEKVNMSFLKSFIAIMLMLIAPALGFGFI